MPDPLQFNVVTLFPEWVKQLENFGIVGRGFRDNRLTLSTWNPRNYTDRRDGRVDDRPFGGGPGMVLQAGPLNRTLDAIAEHTHDQLRPVWLLTPDGERFDQRAADTLTAVGGVTLVCGRYQGIDQRFIDTRVDACVSVGDVVLSGGELPAMMIIDAVARLLPGVLGDPDSKSAESFRGGQLDAPHYTRPPDADVPRVLLSGDHAKIARWRQKQALGTTFLKRPDLFAQLALDANQVRLLNEYLAENPIESTELWDGNSQK